MSDRLYQIAFSRLKGITPAAARELLARISAEKDFFTLPARELAERFGGPTAIASDQLRQSLLREAEAEADFISRHDVTPIYFTDPRYPQRLLEAPDAPLMLYTVGDCDLNPQHVVSIVGTRNCTSYAHAFIHRLVEELNDSLESLLIVSGLASGCDSLAHKRALELRVPTAGVVAHGLDTLYPAENRNLAGQMVRQGGAVITDYIHGTRPLRPNFLARNRIVAAMADAVVVVESRADKGGALHTARLALNYNREVFALPGRTSDLYSSGCNKLIKTNVAHLIDSAKDIIRELSWTPRKPEGSQQTMFPTLTETEQRIVDHIRQLGEASLNDLSVALGIPTREALNTLVELEFSQVVTALPGNRYRIL